MNLIRMLIDGVRPVIAARRAAVGPRRPTWTLDYETAVEVMRRGSPWAVLVPSRVQRKLVDPPRPPTGPVKKTRMERISVGRIPAEWFSLPTSDPDRVFLYLHGGGYTSGSVDSHRDLLARMCIASGFRILAPEYRLAPEHPFPAQLEDGLQVYQWLLDQGIAPEHIVIGGESAGANLTLATLFSLRDQGKPLPAAAVCISGWLDMHTARKSLRNRKYDFINGLTLKATAKRVMPNGDYKNPLISPVYGDFTGLPPLLIQAGEAESLLDDSLRAAKAASKAGVDVTLEVWPDMVHAWHVLAPLSDDGQRAINRVGEFVKESVG